MSDVKIGIDNGKDLMLMGYSGCAILHSGGSLFEGRVWKESGFGLIVIVDKDKSILENGVVNQRDKFFIAIELPPHIHIRAEDSIKICIIPPSGITKVIDLYIPFSCSSDIVFLE